MKKILAGLFLFLIIPTAFSQIRPGKNKATQPSAAITEGADTTPYFKPLRWRNIGPFRGGRSVAVTGVTDNPLIYYMGTTGGGLWKTYNAGGTWQNISDNYFKTGSVGAVAVAESDPNVVFVGMGEHAPRGVMTSYGDGVYKSTDAGKTWKKIGLDLTRQIAAIRIHPTNPDVVYVAAQGAINGPTKERGIYKSIDGGVTWKNVLYVDENTGCADLSMDMTNPRILYAAMWDHRRLPWVIQSGGKGSGLYKSVDGGETWTKIQKGLPKELGKMAVAVSPANPEKVYALVESDTEKDLGGLFVSENAGKSWTLVSKDHRLTQRAWYYIEITADPQNENTIYAFNSPGLKSTDGGKSWTRISGTHGDYHQLWINPKNNENMIIANDGGAAVSFNGGKIWSSEDNQPTGQFYRLNADNRFPYNIYGGQQDNSSVMISSRNAGGYSIGQSNWSSSAGGESAFIAFDPDSPRYIMGGSYQGTIELFDQQIREGKLIMASPIQYQSLQPKDMKYRFNWNAPIVNSPNNHKVFYHAGNVLLRTEDMGTTWKVISPDLTTHDTAKMGMSGIPYTNEGAGGENYCTISYVTESAKESGVIWTGSDDGLVYITRDNGTTWSNVTPAGMGETLVNCIEVSPHQNGTAYIAATKYKMNDLSPALYKTTDYGKSWKRINNGIPYGAYTRCIREDDVKPGLLYAGTETGFYISFDGGNSWKQEQLNLPITPITDLMVHKGNLIAATMGRAFWVLDDLFMLRLYDTKTARNFTFYKPADAYRVSGSSVLDELDEEDDAAPAVLTSGVNALGGVPLYYYLPGNTDSIKISLTIKDDKGNIVRTFSNKADKNFIRFPGGPTQEPLLPFKRGLNLFVWDMRYQTLPGVPRVFIEGSYQGHKAAPGNYNATLKNGSQEQKITFSILPDPRIKAPAEAYALQATIQQEVDDKVRDIHEMILQLRKVRTQISDMLALLDTSKYKSLNDAGKKLVENINTWEDKLVQNKAQSNDDIINYINRLTADYIFLKGEMDTNIPGVTNGQKERLAELNNIWAPLKKEGDDIAERQVNAFNKLYESSGLGKVIVPGDYKADKN